MSKVTRVMSFGMTLLLVGAPALATTTGTPMDTVTQQVLHLVSGPIALLMIIAGFVGAGLIYFMGRNFEAAFLTLSALAVGGVLCSQIQPMATYLFPVAGALIR